VAVAATREKSAHVVLRCITRSKTIATPVNGSLIVRPILSRQRPYIRAVHRDDKRTALVFGVACLTSQNVTRHNSLIRNMKLWQISTTTANFLSAKYTFWKFRIPQSTPSRNTVIITTAPETWKNVFRWYSRRVSVTVFICDDFDASLPRDSNITRLISNIETNNRHDSERHSSLSAAKSAGSRTAISLKYATETKPFCSYSQRAVLMSTFSKLIA